MHEYAELHCQSAFSLLDGASLPETLIERASQLGYHALALTDYTDLGGVVRFAQRAQELSFNAIIGLQLSVECFGQVGRLVLLAENEHGYRNLCRHVTSARLSHVRGLPHLSWSEFAQRTEGLICLTGGFRGVLYRSMIRRDEISSQRFLSSLKDVFEDRLVIEVTHQGTPLDTEIARSAIHLARKTNTRWVVSNDVRYAEPDRRCVYDTMKCLKSGTRLSESAGVLLHNAEFHLKTRDEHYRRWAEALDGLRESIHIAEQCRFRLGMLAVPLPQTNIPSDFHDPHQYLVHLVDEGIRRRWGSDVSSIHLKQIEHELSLIQRRQLSGYFLIMWEIVSFADRVSILVQGRGSAANSAVCYVLGITAVDPISHGLLFERFLSDARDGYPDIDLDIEHARREEVIQFVYDKYGRNHAAMVCAHHCFRRKSAIRDVSRVLGFTPSEADKLVKVTRNLNTLNTDVLKTRMGWNDARFQGLIDVVEGLEKLPRQRATHSGGFVLSAAMLGSLIPVEPAAMDGRTILQWDKDDLDIMKIPKFDLLGLGILSAIAKGLQLIRARHGVPVHLYSLPQQKVVYDMIGQADTVGVFQIESRAQMNSLPRTQPQNLYELAIQVALIRPGPLQGDMVHPYIRRRRGEENVDLIHPLVAPILRRTLGVPLFQEQGMRLAIDVAGFSPSDAERLRRAMSSERSRSSFSGLLAQLERGLLGRGISKEATDRLVRQITAFSTYGFPESHSTSFALLVYASCWIKCLYPGEYLVAILRAQPMGFYQPDTLIADAQRHGVEVHSPCFKWSGWHTRFVGDSVYVGLRWIRGLGPHVLQTLEKTTKSGQFKDLNDVFRRCHFDRDVWIVLAKANVFRAWIPEGRRQAVWQVLNQFTMRQLPLPLLLAKETCIELPKLSKKDMSAQDYETMSLSTGVHPISFYRNLLPSHCVASNHLSQMKNNQWLAVAGMVIARQRPETAKGFCFVSLEDEHGFVNVIISPKVFERYCEVLLSHRMLMIAGTVSSEHGVVNLKASHVESIGDIGTLPLPKCYDFR